MKKVLVFLAIIAAVVVTTVSCNKKSPEEIAIEQVQKACVGDWTGTLPLGQQVNVTITPNFKITTTGNFSAQIANWYYKSGAVWVELNDPNHTAMSIEVFGVKMKITSNSLDIIAALPSELNKLLK